MKKKYERFSRWNSIVLALFAGITLFAWSDPASIARDRFAFDAQIALSPKAAARLATLSEKIIVAASYSGNPTPEAQKHADEIGQIDLGREEVEISGKAGSAHLTGARVHRARLAWIQGPILLNVNVYSARHSGPDNILACDFFDGKLENARRKPVQFFCSLIEEHTETKHKE